MLQENKLNHKGWIQARQLEYNIWENKRHSKSHARNGMHANQEGETNKQKCITAAPKVGMGSGKDERNDIDVRNSENRTSLVASACHRLCKIK